jgi:hypothetical protein
VIHGPGVLRVGIETRGVPVGSVIDVFGRNGGTSSQPWPMVVDGSRLTVTVPLAALVDEQRTASAVWTMRVRTRDGVLRVGRSGADVVQLNRASYFHPITVVGRDGSRTRVRPYFAKGHVLAVRLTRLASAAVASTTDAPQLIAKGSSA